MLDTDSRYAEVPTATYTTAEGREIVYVTRRFLPRAQELTPLARVLVNEADRLDQIAGRTIGDPLQYWMICDSNEAMSPEALVLEPGRILLIATSA